MKEKGGYDVEFVGIGPKNVTCSICLFVLREPMQAVECGHRFCKSCIEDLKDNREVERITCPQDRIVNKIFRDRGKERDILDYVIKCTNVSNGCEWTGELRDLEKHKEICEYHLTSCKNEGCGKEFERRFLEQHTNAECSLRVINCEYCKVEVKFCLLEEHNQGCSEKPVECSRCKSKDIPKDMINQHLELECPFIVCDYSDIGCQKTVKRKCMSDHKENSTENHIDCVISKIREQSETIKRQKLQLEEQKNTINGLQEKINEISGKLRPTEAFKNEVIWVIDDFKKKFEKAKKEKAILYNTFFTPKGYKCKAHLYLNGCHTGACTHVTLYFGVEEGPFDDALDWPMDAEISYCVLKNGLEENKRKLSTTSFDAVKQVFEKPPANNVTSGGYNKFIPQSSISNLITDDSLTLRISIA